jgi:hypothetical protein|tara:strand:- start:440 stop:1339 length:900 start_codon:yes stop_codon:yes gene_type:complete
MAKINYTKNQPEYLNHIRDGSAALKHKFDNDVLIILTRHLAREKIDAALKPDGTLDWKLLPDLVTSNPKLEKTPDGVELITGGFALAPSWTSGYNACSNASQGCGENCLFNSGHGQRHMQKNGTHPVWIARITRMILWMEHREEFKKRAIKEIQAHKRKADRLGVTCGFRPNIIADIKWESVWPELFELFPDVVFYDYAKDPNRDVSHIPNYSLTFSRSERNDWITELMLDKGINVTVVMRIKKGQPLPSTFRGRPVIDGDLHDFRPIDPKGVWVGLRPKGKTAWSDTSGFVIDVPQEV